MLCDRPRGPIGSARSTSWSTSWRASGAADAGHRTAHPREPGRVNLPALLEGRSLYQRTVRGSSDCAPSGDAFVHTVRVADPDREVEVAIEARPSPSYAVRSIAARALAGRVDAGALGAMAGLTGALASGLGRRVRELTGAAAGADVLLDGVIEVARLARQVTCLPR